MLILRKTHKIYKMAHRWQIVEGMDLFNCENISNMLSLLNSDDCNINIVILYYCILYYFIILYIMLYYILLYYKLTGPRK